MTAQAQRAGTLMAILTFLAAFPWMFQYPSHRWSDELMNVAKARSLFDATLYSKDWVLQSDHFHVPIYAAVIHLLDLTIGVRDGTCLLTLLVLLFTVLVTLRFARELGGWGILLPIAFTFSACLGLGKGYEGMFRFDFHMHQFSCTLLFCAYLAFLRERFVWTGVLLGMVIAAHPINGLHGAVIISVAALFTRRWRALGMIALVSGLVSAPFTIPMARSLFLSSARETSVERTIVDGYIFRIPHELLLDSPYRFLQYATYLVLGAAAVLGARTLTALRPELGTKLRAFSGLLIGHAILLLAAIATTDPLFDGAWRYHSTALFLFHFSRSSAHFAFLLSCLALFPLEIFYVQQEHALKVRALLGLNLIAVALLIALIAVGKAPFDLRFALFYIASPILLLAFLRGRWWRPALATGVALVLLAFAHLAQKNRDLPLSASEAELFHWVQAQTPRDALFIVPPNFAIFRLFAERSVYVDFKTAPFAAPGEMLEWRRRLEEVAEPDARALQSRGFPAADDWARCYANISPDQLAPLLEKTHADFLISSQAAGSDAALEIAFHNDQFTVYRLGQKT